ncbi:MAG TPA: AtpZ/AtpI family protein [Phycisphaerae bacterium]|nr:AtpZ/AtpI family protein [Phycisphaerae bacterium]
MAAEPPPTDPADRHGAPDPDAVKRKTPGWIDTLAKRSTGLPGDESPPPPSSPSGGDDPSLWKWAGVGLQFAASVAIFLLIGRWIDTHFGWSYAATLSLLAIALIGNFYLLIKDATRNNK